MVLAVATGLTLWQHHAGIERQRRLGPHRAILARSSVAIATGLSLLLPT